MNFSGVSLHSPEIGVCQPKVYGDIQSHHNMSSTLHILSTGKYEHHMFYIHKTTLIGKVVKAEIVRKGKGS